MTPPERFIIYIRTKQIMTYRLKNATDIEPVFINATEIETRFFPFPKYKRKDEVQKLVDKGLIKVNNEGKAFSYEVTRPGEFDLSLLQKKEIPADDLTQYIYKNLQKVSLAPESESTQFFDLFLKYQKTAPYLFFVKDSFCCRIHTPISGLHRTIRPHLLIEGAKTVSIDITTCQVLILSKILFDAIGENDLSKNVNEGKDVYLMLLDKGGFENRDLAKKGFLKILFSPDLQFVTRTFGKSNWTEWIIKYKSNPEPRNPKPKHGHTNPHYNNLAYLLQSTEVNLMQKVWQMLKNVEIPFLTVHDSIVVKQSDQQRAYELFSEVMRVEFPKYYHWHTEELKEPTNVLKYQLPPELISIQIQYSELEQNNKISPQHHPKVIELWDKAKHSLKNKSEGLNEIIKELREYKKLITL